jgi:hypothetical protein
MPRFSFSEEEFKDDSQNGQSTEEAVLEELEESPEVELADDELDSEVEKRLEVAEYYRLILKQDLFNDRSEAASRVQKEIRSFVRGRLEVLVGLKPAHQPSKPVELPFSPTQLEALKKMADVLIRKGGQRPPEGPSIKTVEVPQEEKPATQLQKAEGPKLNQVAGKQSEPKPVAKKPGPKPKAKTNQPIKGKPVETPQDADGPEDPLPDVQAVETKDGIFKIGNGKRYKLVPHPTKSEFKIWLDVSGQAKPTGIQPTPVPSPLDPRSRMVEEIQAEQALEGIDRSTNLAIAASLAGK